MNSKKILIVDDKFSVTRMISEYLQSKGYIALIAHNGVEALTEARIHKPDLILLDIMMPQMDGMEFIQTFRKESSIPVILLTAKIEETNKVFGLGIGADDYVTKPFSLAELVARIQAVLRRSDPSSDPTRTVSFENLIIYPDKHEVIKNDQMINLTPTEYELLLAMCKQPKRVFTREQLLQVIQGENYSPLEKTINVHIRNLRVKIEDDPANPRLIQTVFGVGYRFNGEWHQ